MIDRIGALWPMGIPVAHSWREIGAILWVIQTHGIHGVLEIGVDQGGLAAVFGGRNLFTGDLAYLGIEADSKRWGEALHRLGDNRLGHKPRIEHVDALSERAQGLVAAWAMWKSGPVLVYCDGGNKLAEFLTYAPTLRRGDVIGVHDVGREVAYEDLVCPGRNLVPTALEWASHAQAFFLA